MKKYKLIKEYPGSPPVGFTTENSHYLGKNNYLVCEKRFNPENYTEFWEEIIEKSFKILQLVAKKTMIFNKETDPCIYQVERLSDGVIFTVGDIVSVNNKKAKIIEIVNIQNDIYLNLDDVRVINFNEAVKLEKSFTTEDGVDMYVGDTCFVLTANDSRGYTKYLIHPEGNYTSNNIRFAKIENVIAYLALNKQHLSVNDIISIIPKKYHKKLIDISRAKL